MGSSVKVCPAHEAIKTRRCCRILKLIVDNYKDHPLCGTRGQCGIAVVTYNFMPVLDWTRKLTWPFELENGAKALKFEKAALVAFDVHMLQRPGAAAADYSHAAELAAGKARFDQMSEEERAVLQRNIIAGLPGSEESFSLEQFQQALDKYEGIDAEQLSRQSDLFSRRSYLLPMRRG